MGLKALTGVCHTIGTTFWMYSSKLKSIYFGCIADLDYLYSMKIIDAQIEEYCRTHTQSPDGVLQELERQTYVTRLMPQMLSGALQVSLLQMLVKLLQPKVAVEIGTFTGYSAIAVAQALPADGFLHTIEINEELESMILKYFRKAGVDQKIQLHIGDALDKLKVIEGRFDFAFIDADKENYPNYYEVLVPRMNKGGVIVADNVLWSGKVVENIKPNDRQTQAIDEFNKIVLADERVENVLIPIRDGLNVIRVR